MEQPARGDEFLRSDVAAVQLGFLLAISRNGAVNMSSQGTLFQPKMNNVAYLCFYL
jgi:hypothetical protein